MSLYEKAKVIFSPRKEMPNYKLADDSTPSSPSKGETKSQFEDFLQRANKVGVRASEPDWVFVDKEQVEEEMRREQEEQDKEEWYEVTEDDHQG